MVAIITKVHHSRYDLVGYTEITFAVSSDLLVIDFKSHSFPDRFDL